MRLTVSKFSSSIIFSYIPLASVRSSVSLPVTASSVLIRRGADSRSIILPTRSVYTGYFTNNNQSRRMSGYSSDYVSEKLKQNLKTTHLDVIDVSDGCGAKFECVIVSPLFEGKSILQRHRMVNETLAEELKSIHAFSMRTLTPEQWDKLQSNS